MDCKQTRELVFLFTDNELGQDTKVAFQNHVDTCPGCAQQARYARRLVSVVRHRAIRWPAPTHLRDRILSVVFAQRTV